jgi:transcriptional regulator with XRE-family HTH domain
MHKSKNSARHTLARILKARRKELKLSQEKLAELAELHRNYVGAVERGEVNIAVDNIEKLAKALSIDVCDFFLNNESLK